MALDISPERLKKIKDIQARKSVPVNKVAPKLPTIKANRPRVPPKANNNSFDPNSGNQPQAGQFISTEANVARNNNLGVSTQTDTIDQLAQAKKNRAIASLTEAFNKNKSSLEAEDKALTGAFRKERGNVNVQDTMSREATRKALATGGLGSSGVVGQSDIAQNIITQGARSQLTEQEQGLKADIERRLTENQRALDLGIASAESEADIIRLQSELDRINREEAIAREDKLRQQSIAREDELRQQSITREDEQLARKEGTQADELQRQQFLNTIGQFDNDIQARINEIANDNDTSNDWQIPYLKARRVQKIQGIEQSRAEQEQLQLQTQEDAQTQAREDAEFRLKQFGQVLNEQDAQILGVPIGTRTADYQNQLSLAANRNRTSKPKEPKDKFNTNVFDNSIKNAIDNLGDEFNLPTLPEQKATASDIIVRENENGNMSDAQAQELIIKYNLTVQDIQQAENRTGLLEELRGR